jgi:transcriptional regulator with XRE-family HTH domain
LSGIVRAEALVKWDKLFGRRVRSVRTSLNLGQEEVAAKIGIEAKHLGRIERGERRPSFQLIFDLARAMNVSPRVLFEFDRDDLDCLLLRKKIDALFEKCSPQQLQQAYRILKSLLEP